MELPPKLCPFAPITWNVFLVKLPMGKYDYRILNAFVDMSNHVHGIIVIDKPYDDGATVETRHALSLHSVEQPSPSEQLNKTVFKNHGKHPLSSIIGSYKPAVTENADQKKICRVKTEKQDFQV